MDIFSIVQATQLKVEPVRKTYIKLPAFLAFEVNFSSNKSHFKVFDILENDFFGDFLKEDTLIEKEFDFELSDIDDSQGTPRLNLFSLPDEGPENQILQTLKTIHGTTTPSKREKEPFSCSIFFNENNFIRQIDFNSFFRGSPNSLEYSNSANSMNTSLNFTNSATLIANAVSNTENWEFVQYYSRLKASIQTLTIDDFHLSIDLINCIFHQKLIKALKSKEFSCDRDYLIEKHGDSFTTNWSHLDLENFAQIITEVKQEVNNLHKKHLESYKLT